MLVYDFYSRNNRRIYSFPALCKVRLSGRAVGEHRNEREQQSRDMIDGAQQKVPPGCNNPGRTFYLINDLPVTVKERTVN